jgi:hypothetical protein
VWPETHSKSTAVERCSVRVVWRNTKKISKVCPQYSNSFADKSSKYHLEKNCMVHAHNHYHNTTGERHILSLKANCNNTSNGCEWAGELRSLNKHLASWDFTLLSCRNESHNRFKVVQLLCKDMKKHTGVPKTSVWVFSLPGGWGVSGDDD